MEWFEKNKFENKEFEVTEYACYLAQFDVMKIFESIYESNAWSNGVDYIGGSYTDEWELKKMHVGIYYPFLGKYHIEPLKKQKYMDLLTQLRNIYAAEYSESKELDEVYQSILAKFDKISGGYQ